MIINTFDSKKDYNPEDHLFIFLSLIYAFAVNYCIFNISNVFISLPSADNNIWKLNNLTVLLWNLLLLVLTAESWWAVWADKEHLTRHFVHFLALLSYPVILCIVLRLLSSVQMDTDTTSFPKIQYAYTLVGAAILVGSILVIRVFFDKNKNNIRTRICCIAFCLSLAVYSYFNGKNNFYLILDPDYEIFILSLICLAFGFTILFAYIKSERSDLFNKPRLDKKEFLQKISRVASLPYRYNMPFCIFVIKLTENYEEHCNASTYQKILDKIDNKIRGYHICSNLTDHIAIFVPYIHATAFDTDQELTIQDLEKFRAKLESNITECINNTNFEIRTGFEVTKFNKDAMVRISRKPPRKRGKSYQRDLNSTLKKAYNLAYERATV